MTLLGTTPNFAFGLINYRTNPWQEEEYKNWRALDTILATITSLSSIQGVWQNATAYTVGQKLVDGTTGVLYEVMVAHTSAASPTTFVQDRVAHPTFWQVVGGGAASFGEYSVKNFGAAGNGTTDDTAAFQQALTELRAVFVPEGTYKLTAPLVLTENQFLFGNGAASVLQFRASALDKAGAASYNSVHNGLVLNGSYCTVADLTIVGANKAILLTHDASPVVSNQIRGIDIWDAVTGIELDGGSNTNYPVYWNDFHSIRIIRPRDVGVKLHVSSTGDTPNANKFRHVRVYSLGASLVNDRYGFWIEDGRYGNAFVDCEANLETNATACMHLGDGAGGNWIVNFVAECLGSAAGISMDGAAGTDVSAGANTLINYFHTTAGSAIYNPAGTGVYYTLFGGFPDRCRLPRTRIEKAIIEDLSFESTFTDSSGTIALPTQRPVQLLSAFNGAINFNLPAPADAEGKIIFIAKTDTSTNSVTIRQADNLASGPGGKNHLLNKENEFVITYSNGAEWLIFSTSDVRFQANSYDATASGDTYTLNAGNELHLVTAATNTCNVIIPEPSSANAGKRIVIKRQNSTGGAVLVKRLATKAAEGIDYRLDAQYSSVTLLSNGAAWWEMAATGTVTGV